MEFVNCQQFESVRRLIKFTFRILKPNELHLNRIIECVHVTE